MTEWKFFFSFHHHVRLLFNEVYGGVQWRKKRSLKDLSNWNLFVVDSSNGSVRAHILFTQQRKYFYFSQIKPQNILTGNCVHTKQKSHTFVMGLFDYSNFFMIIVSTHNFREWVLCAFLHFSSRCSGLLLAIQMPFSHFSHQKIVLTAKFLVNIRFYDFI